MQIFIMENNTIRLFSLVKTLDKSVDIENIKKQVEINDLIRPSLIDKSYIFIFDEQSFHVPAKKALEILAENNLTVNEANYTITD